MSSVFISPEPSLRDKQIGMFTLLGSRGQNIDSNNATAVLERMLNLNKDKVDEVGNAIEKVNADGLNAVKALESLKDSSQTQWKVLVFDSFGRDVISSVLRVNDLFKVSDIKIFFTIIF